MGNRDSKGRFIKGMSYSADTQFKKAEEYPAYLFGSKFYTVWQNMKSRCNNPNNVRYHRYGGKGISYNPSWETFAGFYKDMYGSYDESLQLDRIDNDGNYTKDNCRWVSAKENSLNRSQTHLFKYNDRELTLSDWARNIGMNISTLEMRIHVYKWSIEKALTTPVRRQA